MRWYEVGRVFLKMKMAHLAPVPLPLPHKGRGARWFPRKRCWGVGPREKSIRVEGEDTASMDEDVRKMLLAPERIGNLSCSESGGLGRQGLVHKVTQFIGTGTVKLNGVVFL
jgi:hypothetical protein